MSTNDTGPMPGALEREHQRLRRQVRWLTLGLLLTLALLLVGEVLRWQRSTQDTRMATPGELRVQRLVITDKAGRTRAELGLAPDAQEPQLVLYHPNGQRWAALAMVPPPDAPEGPREAALLLHDEAGKTRVSLGASGRSSGMVLYDPQGIPGLALYLEPDSQGFVISDGAVPRIHLRYNQHNDTPLSELIFRDEQKGEQAILRGGRGGASLNLYRPDGERTFQAP